MAVQGSSDPEIVRIRDRVEALIKKGLEDHQAYLLSSLGLSLGSDLNLLKHRTGQRLIDFINQHFRDTLEIVQHGEHSNIYAVRQLGLVAHTEGAPSHRPLMSKTESSNTRSPRFNHRFWAAFAKPLTMNCRAFDLSKMSFTDFPSEEQIPENFVLIPPNLIPNTEMTNRDEAIKRNIDAWLQSHSLDREQFLAKTLHKTSAKNPPMLRFSLLDHVIDCLDHAQLKSTSLTLDVVKSLLQKVV